LPEFLNRLDGMVIFEPLGRDELVAVARLILGRTAATAKTRGITLTWDDDVADWLGAQAFADTSFSGARPLRQLISKHIEDSIVETTFVGGAGQPHMGRTVHVTVAEGALQVRDSAAVPQAFVEMD
jgi:ATP-dependent Clp protease ATP-binding subunit ClpA